MKIQSFELGGGGALFYPFRQRDVHNVHRSLPTIAEDLGCCKPPVDLGLSLVKGPGDGATRKKIMRFCHLGGLRTG